MKKLKILELDITSITEGFTAYSAGIYQKTMSVPQAVQDASPITTIFGATWETSIEPIVVGSVRVDNTILGSLDSLDELRYQDGAFYFDIASQILYIALFEYYPAQEYKSYKIGETTGFISEAQKQYINGQFFPVDSYLGSIYYEPRLNDDLSIVESVDDQANGIFVYNELTASINNADGSFDNIRDNITGNEARVLIANISETPEEEFSTGIPYKTRANRDDFKPVREGIVEDVDYSDPANPVIKAIDPRSDWTQTIGTRRLTTTDFPNLENGKVDKLRPVLIGIINGSACIQLEPSPASATAIDFLICDTDIGDIDSVTGIYFDGTLGTTQTDRFLTAGEYSVNTTTGVLTINNFKSGKAYFYGVVTEMAETVEIILYLLEEFAGLAYIASNFNQNEIEQIRALNYKSHVYIDDSGESLETIIEQLVNSIQVDFFQQGSVFTMRDSNEERPSSEDITPYQITDNPAPWVNDRTETVKTIAIGYNKDYRTGEYETYYDATKEQEAIDNNRKAIDKVIETNLSLSTDVISIYDPYYSRFTKPSRTITINRTFEISAGLTDFVTFKVERQTMDGPVKVFERGIYKITQLDQDSNTAEAVYFSDRAEPYFSIGVAAGVRNRSIVTTGSIVENGRAVYLDGSYLSVASVPTIREGLIVEQLRTRTRGYAFGAPNSNRPTSSFSGVPAFRTAAFKKPATIGGVAIGFKPVPGSGNKAGITQQVGE